MPWTVRWPWSKHGETGAPRSRGLQGRPRLRAFLATLIIGISIEAALLGLQAAGVLVKSEDAGADLFMRLYRGMVFAPDRAQPIVYIDIDDETHSLWGDPAYIPPERLARIVEAVLPARPAAVIVDVDLARPSLPGDAALAEALARWADAAAQADGAGPAPVVLARTLTSAAHDPGSVYPRPRATFVDDIVAASPTLHWASIRTAAGPDLVVRRWRLWEAVCVEGRGAILPSVQLLATALVKEPENGFGEVQDALARLTPSTCTEALDVRRDAALRLGDIQLSLAQGRTEQRILFTIPWRLETGESRPRIPHEGSSVPLLSVIAAHSVAGSGAALDAETLRGRLVLIGGSYAAGRDLHLTPIGPMPGSLIVANAVNTALQHGALQPPDKVTKLGFTAALILAVCLLFFVFGIGTATVLSLLVVVTSTLLLSRYWLEMGIWIDATIPTLAVVVHRWVAMLEFGWERRRLGAKGLLSQHIVGGHHDHDDRSSSGPSHG